MTHFKRLLEEPGSDLERVMLEASADAGSTSSVMSGDAAAEREQAAPQILCAEIPGYFWPRSMADASAITQIILCLLYTSDAADE